MNSKRIVHTVSCHAEGEVGDVIVGGVAPPPGDTLWEQSRWIARDGTLRNFMLNEPRGGVFRHVNLLVPPKNPEAVMGFIIMEPADTPPMSGSNSICVATVLLETGIVPMEEPVTSLVLEAPGGLIRAEARCSGGRVERMTIHNVPSFAHRLDTIIEVEGLGTLTVDTAYGGDSFVITDTRSLGFGITPDEASDIVAAGMRPGKLDRSPTGTGCSARMAVLKKRGILDVGDRYIGESVIGSRFHCRVESATWVGELEAIIPSVSGRAWITGTQQHMLDPTDPWSEGYRVGDTWPASSPLSIR